MTKDHPARAQGRSPAHPADLDDAPGGPLPAGIPRHPRAGRAISCRSATPPTLQPRSRCNRSAATASTRRSCSPTSCCLPQALGAEALVRNRRRPADGDHRPPPARSPNLKPTEAIHDTLAPVYETVRILARELPKETTLIGFAGAPWTVATYMIAGQGSQGSGRRPRAERPGPRHLPGPDRPDHRGDHRIPLRRRSQAGAEVVKLFDSWAGSPQRPGLPAISPRPRPRRSSRPSRPATPASRSSPSRARRARATSASPTRTGADCVALDNSVSPEWAAANVQIDGCVQGNLAPEHMVTGGAGAGRGDPHVVRAFSKGPHIFNLGHGITPEADPDNVQLMIDTVRGT